MENISWLVTVHRHFSHGEAIWSNKRPILRPLIGLLVKV